LIFWYERKCGSPGALYSAAGARRPGLALSGRRVEQGLRLGAVELAGATLIEKELWPVNVQSTSHSLFRIAAGYSGK
jgi:hypothetical protein